jgi:hypothetical protein
MCSARPRFAGNLFSSTFSRISDRRRLLKENKNTNPTKNITPQIPIASGAKRPGEPLNVFYSIKLTQTQRIKLIKLGGPQWIRNQIERSA